MNQQSRYHESQRMPTLPHISIALLLFLCVLVLSACGNNPAVEQSPINTPVEGASNFESLTPPSDVQAQTRTQAAIQAAGTPGPGVDGDLPVREEPAVSIGDISDNTDAYLAETVNVRGEVTSVLTTTAFRVAEPGILGDEVLVVLPAAQASAVQAGETLIIRGVVREFDRYSVETHTGVSFPEGFLSDLDNDIVLMAQSVSPATPSTP
jgi:hypothetical protein